LGVALCLHRNALPQRFLSRLDDGLFLVFLLNLLSCGNRRRLAEMDALENGFGELVQPSHELEADLMDGNIDWEFAFESFLDTTLPAGPMFQGEREFTIS
jgi:hypothetical protein